MTDQLRLEVPPGFRYGYKNWTHPAHRRRNIANACQHLRKTSRRFPFEERSFGYVGWITLFGREVPFRSRHAARLGVWLSRVSVMEMSEPAAAR